LLLLYERPKVHDLSGYGIEKKFVVARLSIEVEHTHNASGRRIASTQPPAIVGMRIVRDNLPSPLLRRKAAQIDKPLLGDKVSHVVLGMIDVARHASTIAISLDASVDYSFGTSVIRRALDSCEWVPKLPTPDVIASDFKASTAGSEIRLRQSTGACGLEPTSECPDAWKSE
jgi:hypothetical protein